VAGFFIFTNMRIIESFTHGQCLVSILKMNSKFIVKIEAGPYEQTFKVDEMDITNLGNLKKVLTPEFLNKVQSRFMAMHAEFSEELAKVI